MILHIVRERIEQRLSVLVGLPLWGMGRAADLEWFQFGGKRGVEDRRGEHRTVGDWTLHVQCAWRIVQAGTILVASQDLHWPAGIQTSADLDVTEEGNWAWDRSGPRRLDERTAALRQVLDTNSPLVEAVEADAVGSLHVGFNGGYALEIFPDTTLEDMEHWRFFEPHRQTAHFVVGGRDATKE